MNNPSDLFHELLDEQLGTFEVERIVSEMKSLEFWRGDENKKRFVRISFCEIQFVIWKNEVGNFLLQPYTTTELEPGTPIPNGDTLLETLFNAMTIISDEVL